MNAKQTLHKAQLEKWFCLLKEECLSSFVPDILPLSVPPVCETRSVPESAPIVDPPLYGISSSCIRLSVKDISLDIPPSKGYIIIISITRIMISLLTE